MAHRYSKIRFDKSLGRNGDSCLPLGLPKHSANDVTVQFSEVLPVSFKKAQPFGRIMKSCAGDLQDLLRVLRLQQLL